MRRTTYRRTTYNTIPTMRVKEDRPIRSKEWRKNKINQLIDFLLENNFPDRNNLTKRKLNPPSTVLFRDVMKFLAFKVLPGATLKDFSDFPNLLYEKLGYPIRIPSSYWSSCPNPCNWGQLLGVCSWMIELVEFNGRARLFLLNEKQTNSPVKHGSHISLKLLKHNFIKSQKGENNIDLVKEYRMYLETENRHSLEEHKSLMEQQKDFEVQIKNDKVTLERLESRRNQQRELEHLCNQNVKAQETCSQETVTVKNAILDLKQKKQKLEHEITLIQNETMQIEKQVENQSMSKFEALTLKNKIAKLSTDMDELQLKYNYQQKKAQTLRLKFTNDFNKLTQLVRTYNQILKQLDLTLKKDLRINLPISAEFEKELLSHSSTENNFHNEMQMLRDTKNLLENKQRENNAEIQKAETELRMTKFDIESLQKENENNHKKKKEKCLLIKNLKKKLQQERFQFEDKMDFENQKVSVALNQAKEKRILKLNELTIRKSEFEELKKDWDTLLKKLQSEMMAKRNEILDVIKLYERSQARIKKTMSDTLNKISHCDESKV